MRIAKLPAAASLLATMTAAALLTGCSGSFEVSAGELPANKLENTVSKKLAAQTGMPEPDISCPEDLAAEVDTTTRCELTAADGSTIGVTVTVTSVEGTQINFDIKVDDQVSSS